MPNNFQSSSFWQDDLLKNPSFQCSQFRSPVPSVSAGRHPACVCEMNYNCLLCVYDAHNQSFVKCYIFKLLRAPQLASIISVGSINACTDKAHHVGYCYSSSNRSFAAIVAIQNSGWILPERSCVPYVVELASRAEIYRGRFRWCQVDGRLHRLAVQGERSCR